MCCSRLPSVFIFRDVRTSANSVALNITVPSLFSGIFIVTNRWKFTTSAVQYINCKLIIIDNCHICEYSRYDCILPKYLNYEERKCIRKRYTDEHEKSDNKCISVNLSPYYECKCTFIQKKQNFYSFLYHRRGLLLLVYWFPKRNITHFVDNNARFRCLLQVHVWHSL